MLDYFPERPWACHCGCGLDTIDPALVRDLNLARQFAEFPFVINSACRCTDHNRAQGGKAFSAHLPDENGLCHAVDIRAKGSRARFKVTYGLILAGFTRIFIYPDPMGWIHADNSRHPKHAQQVLNIY